MQATENGVYPLGYDDDPVFALMKPYLCLLFMRNILRQFLAHTTGLPLLSEYVGNLSI